MNTKNRKRRENIPIWVYSLSLFFILVIASAASAATVSVLPSTQDKAPGETFNVNVNISSGSDTVQTASVQLNYDQTKLTFVNPTGFNAGTLLGTDINDGDSVSGVLEIKSLSTPGQIKYTVVRASQNTDKTVNGVFFTVQFTVKGTAPAGEIPLNLVNVELMKTAGNPITAPTVNPGKVNVTGGDGGDDGGNDGTVNVFVVPSTQDKAQGETFSVNVNISSGPETVQTASVQLNYDQTKLTFVNPTGFNAGTLLGTAVNDVDSVSGILEIKSLSTPGQIKYTVVRTSHNTDKAVNGVFFTVQFTVKDTAPAGEIPLNLVNVELMKTAGIPIADPTVNPGKVNITTSIGGGGGGGSSGITGYNWAFISVPYVLQNSGVSSVLSGVEYDALFGFDPVNKTFAGGVTNFTPQKGYLIHVNFSKPTTLTIQRKTGQPSVPPSFDIVKGWNLVGTSGTNPTNAETMLGAIDSSYYSIWNFNVSSQSYDIIGLNGKTGIVDAEHIGTDIFTMQPGVSYWVWAIEDAELPAYSP